MSATITTVAASKFAMNGWLTARLIAAYMGEKGGTKNTVDYAARKGVQTIFVL